MDVLKSIFEYTLFTYEIFIVAKNTKNLKIKETKFPLKTVRYDINPEYYPYDGISLTSFSINFSTNL